MTDLNRKFNDELNAAINDLNEKVSELGRTMKPFYKLTLYSMVYVTYDKCPNLCVTDVMKNGTLRLQAIETPGVGIESNCFFDRAAYAQLLHELFDGVELDVTYLKEES